MTLPDFQSCKTKGQNYFLSNAQISKFEEDGYLIIPDFFTNEVGETLKREAHRLISEDYNPADHPLTRFSTMEDQPNEQAKSDYFINSNDKVRYFFEATKTDSNSSDTGRSTPAFNKIGHALHEHVPLFRDFSKGDYRVSWILRDLGYVEPIMLQSMIIFKGARGTGGPVLPHQDSTFLYSEPQSAIGFWYALEDCDEFNGTLSFVKGSHKDYEKVGRRFVRQTNQEENRTVIVFEGEDGWQSEDITSKLTVERIRRNSLVLIHGSVIHASERNNDPNRSRIAFTFHCIEGSTGFEYSSRNWLHLDRDNACFQPLYKHTSNYTLLNKQ